MIYTTFESLKVGDQIYTEDRDEIQPYTIVQRNFDGSCIAVSAAHITGYNYKDWTKVDINPEQKVM